MKARLISKLFPLVVSVGLLGTLYTSAAQQDVSGKQEGKAMKGTLLIDGRDGPREMAWEAYRTPEIDPAGLWKWKTTNGRDGTERDSWVTLKYAKGALAGTYRTTRNQVAITDAVLEGKNISFKVERRFRDRVFSDHPLFRI